MRMRLLLVLLCACGRTPLGVEADAGSDAGLVIAPTDAGLVIAPNDAGPQPCVPLALRRGAVLTVGPRVVIPTDNPKLLDGVMTPGGRVFAVLDPQNTRVLLIGPGWVREVNESTTELFRVHLAWNGEQLALTWQAGRRLMFALFDAQGTLQHRRELANTTQADEAVAGFAGGTWVPVWTHGISTIADAWATRIYPDGGDQTLSQKLTNSPFTLGFPASGVSAIVTDAGVTALVLGESSAVAWANLFPTHQREVSLMGSRGRGALVDLGAGGLSAVFYGAGPNSRRPDLERVDLQRDGGIRYETIAREPSLFSIQDVTAASCAGRVVVGYTDDTTGAGSCIGDYCQWPLLHVTTGLDGGDWRSPETDGGYVRSVTFLKNGDALDVAWLSATSDGTAQVTIAPSLIACCGP